MICIGCVGCPARPSALTHRFAPAAMTADIATRSTLRLACGDACLESLTTAMTRRSLHHAYWVCRSAPGPIVSCIYSVQESKYIDRIGRYSSVLGGITESTYSWQRYTRTEIRNGLVTHIDLCAAGLSRLSTLFSIAHNLHRFGRIVLTVTMITLSRLLVPLTAGAALLAYLLSGISLSSFTSGFRTCTIIPYGGGLDDTEQIHRAVEQCGTGGTIYLPPHYTYSIQKVLRTHLVRSTLKVGQAHA